ncbi:hypothetical protein ACC720_38335, partial [Rhizobium ruizarguesonis]
MRDEAEPRGIVIQNASANALVPREAARPSPMADIQKIAQHMARLNVAALPRNYELFHEAIFQAELVEHRLLRLWS